MGVGDYSQEAVDDAPHVVTIGNFDGVHRGHQALIHRALVLAHEQSEKMVVLTFDPHPSIVLGQVQDRFLITPGPIKGFYLAEANATLVKVVSFDKRFASLDPETFLDSVLTQQLHASTIVVGYNFRFGQGGRGDAGLLRQWGRRNGVTIEILAPISEADDVKAVSSSSVRRHIAAGEIEEACQLLGHAFSVAGVVRRGHQRGRTMDVPTINLQPPSEQIMPPYGVYAGYVAVAGQWFKAVANWGIRPTFDAGEPILEIHALGSLPEELYGYEARFDMFYRLREERRFESVEALVQQIRVDVHQANALLSDLSESGMRTPDQLSSAKD